MIPQFRLSSACRPPPPVCCLASPAQRCGSSERGLHPGHDAVARDLRPRYFRFENAGGRRRPS